MAEKKSLMLYYEYERQFALLSDEQLGRLIRAMLAFDIYGVIPDFSDDPKLEMTFSFISAQLERDKTKFEQKCAVNSANGRKGGRPSKQTVADKTEKSERFSDKPKKADEDKDEEKEKEEEKGEDEESVPTRRKYGRYNNVLLSDDDISQLKTELPNYQEYIERLSEYMESSGKNYNSHLATIRRWAKSDAEKNGDTSPLKEKEYEDFYSFIKNGGVK